MAESKQKRCPKNCLKYFPVILWLLVFIMINTQTVFGQTINVNINPSIIKNNDFAQLLGGYLSTRGNLNPASRFDISNPKIVTEARKTFPQPPEFPNPVVMRTQSYKMLDTDYFAITDGEVEDIIKFCSQANCDPMFGALGEGNVETHNGMTGRVIDVSEVAIKKRANFVKNKCQQYFNDNRHCRHWDIGNEPPSPKQNCDYYVTSLIPTAIKAVKSEIPDAVFHAPELYSESAKVRNGSQYLNYTIGECIARGLQTTDPNLKIEAFSSHWYPYSCYSTQISGTYSAFNIDGNAILKWQGFGGTTESMLYPHSIMSTFNSWINNYDVTKNSAISIGELNPMASCHDVSQRADEAKVTEAVNTTWGGAFWHLDLLGIMAEAGIKYVQKHIYISGGGGTYELMIYNQGNVFKTSPYYAYQFYAQNFGRRVVESNSNNPGIVNSHASLDKDGNLRVLLINKSGSGFKPNSLISERTVAEPKTINLRISNFNPGQTGEAYLFKVPVDFVQKVQFTESSLFKTQTNIPVSDNFSFTVPAYTAVIIKIPASGSPSPSQLTPAPTSVIPTPTSTPAPLSLNFKAGFNNLVLGSTWPVGRSLSSLPADCSLISHWENGFFESFKRTGAPSEVFVSGQRYYILCNQSVAW